MGKGSEFNTPHNEVNEIYGTTGVKTDAQEGFLDMSIAGELAAAIRDEYSSDDRSNLLRRALDAAIADAEIPPGSQMKAKFLATDALQFALGFRELPSEQEGEA